MAVGVFIIFLFVVIGIGGGLLLYVLIRSEHGNRQVMEREQAEQTARIDTVDEED